LNGKVIISDIDGTVLEKGVPIDAVIKYIKKAGFSVHFLTNRPESDRSKTIKDLEIVGIESISLIMNGGDEPSGIFKNKAVKKLMDDGDEPQEFIDDSIANRNAVASLGIKVTNPADIVSLDCGGGSNSKTMTLEQTLKTLKSAFTNKSTEAESLAKEMSELKAKNATLVAEFCEVSEKLEATAALASERDAAIAKVEELTKALAASEAIKSQAAAQIETVGKKAAAIAASVGVAPVEISAADSAIAKTSEEVWSEYCAMKNPAEKLAFYNKNRAAIVAHLGIK
jgi:hypothetical protein